MTWVNKIVFFLICALIVFTTLAYGTVHQPIIGLFYALVSLMVVLWAIDCIFGGRLRVSRSLLQLPLILTAVYGLVQIIPFGTAADVSGISGIPNTISLDPFNTQLTAVHFIILSLLFAVVLVYLDSASRLSKLVRFITIFGFVFAFFGILQSFLSPGKVYGIYETKMGASFGSFVNRHNFAAFIEMAIALPLGLIFTGSIKKDKRLLYITAIALMGVSLLLSRSRGGLIAFVAEVGLLVILTWKGSSSKQFALKAALAGLLVLGIIGGAIFVGGESSLSRFAETATSKDVTTERAHIWKVTLSAIGQNMPLGAGLSAYGVAYTPFDDANGLERVEQAHNDYLQVLSDAGIPGLIIGIFFIFLLARTGLRNAGTGNTFRRGIAIGALTGCFAILVHSMFDFVLHITAISVMFIVMMGLLVASGHKYDDDEPGLEIEPSRKRKNASVTPISEARRRVEREA
jgi:O-antigen ligase